MRGISLVFVLGVLAGCGSRPELSTGESCEHNSDCASPLVCEFDRCRRQCAESRDCGAGLRCIRVDNELGGVCQLPPEARCALSSECPGNLVCQMSTCSNECLGDRDCVFGARCDALEGGGFGCFEPLDELCVYHSDCPENLICTAKQRCQLECLEPRDCPYPRMCSADNLCELPDGGV